MPVKLHRCPVMWPNTDRHPCFRVQNALDEMGVEYEVVTEPWPRFRKRKAVIEATGQNGLPAIEFEDGTWYREQSRDMAARILAGRLFATGEERGAAS